VMSIHFKSLKNTKRFHDVLPSFRISRFSTLIFLVMLQNILTSQYSAEAGQPSFDCSRASKLDEIAICNDAYLSQLDNIANEGYQYLRSTMGARQANSIDMPIIRKRQNCGSDKECIKFIQMEAINLFRGYGAPISAPQNSPPPQVRNNNNYQEVDRSARQQAEQEAAAAQAARQQAEYERQAAQEAKQRAEQEAEIARQQAIIAEQQRKQAIQEAQEKDLLLKKEQEKLREQEVINDQNHKKDEDINQKLLMLATIVGAILACAIYFIPSVIAFKRNHEYKWVILALNTFGGFTGIIWIAVLVWAIYPHNKSMLDPLVGPVTGRGSRNAGDPLGEANFGLKRGYSNESGKQPAIYNKSDIETELEMLEKLHALKVSGAISLEEFEERKNSIKIRLS
jgi:uncharacterized protein